MAQVATFGKESQSSYRASEIAEISPQIKPFYQPLIAVQTNYILANFANVSPEVLL